MVGRGISRVGALYFVLALAPSCTSGGRQDIPSACTLSSALKPPCASGFVGYACAGSARPDENADFVEGTPQGLVCTDEGKVGGGSEGYCCTSATTPCAYDPVAGCAAPTYGYECRGSDRPEAFDPSLFCGEGLVENDLIVYCCGAAPMAHGCSQIAGHTCPSTLVGWTCHDQSAPSEVELGSNQSRADFNLLVCGMPTVVMGTTGAVRQYCCFTPTSLPKGGSCLGDTAIPGCAPDSFGFACTGPDTPNEDYPRIACRSAGVRGTNPQGYAATLYCCQYESMDGG